MFELVKNKEYNKLLEKIGSSFQQAKQRAYKKPLINLKKGGGAK